MKEQIKAEARQLPFTLGKLVGGLMAVIGFGGTVMVLTRRPDPSWSGVLPYAAAGIAGLAVFIVSSRLLAGRANKEGEAGPTAKDKAKTSAVSWIILLILAALFIAIVFIVAI